MAKENNDGLQGASKEELLRQLRSLRAAHMALASKHGALVSRLLSIVPDPKITTPGARHGGVAAMPVDVLRQAMRDISALLRANAPGEFDRDNPPVKMRRGIQGAQPCVGDSEVAVAFLLRHVAEDARLLRELAGQLPAVDARAIKLAICWAGLQMEAMRPGEESKTYVDISDVKREFIVYLDKRVPTVDTDKETVDVNPGEDANEICREVLETLFSNELDAGWYDVADVDVDE